MTFFSDELMNIINDFVISFHIVRVFIADLNGCCFTKVWITTICPFIQDSSSIRTDVFFVGFSRFFQAFLDRSKRYNSSWYHRHLNVPQDFPAGKIQLFVQLFIFFYFHFEVS